MSAQQPAAGQRVSRMMPPNIALAIMTGAAFLFLAGVKRGFRGVNVGVSLGGG